LTQQTQNTDTLTKSSPETPIPPTEIEWIPFPYNNNLQKQASVNNYHTTRPWHPNHSIQYQHQIHPLLHTITNDDKIQLRTLCQHAQNIPLIRCAHDHSLFITLQDIRSLVTHSHPTNDHIMLIYIKLVSETYNIPYLNTDFIPRLEKEGWIDVR
jgi:hypothetical protein